MAIKMKCLIAAAAGMMLVPAALFSQDPVDTMHKKTQDRLGEIRMKDEAHQRKILERFNKFYQSVTRMAPDLKISMPVHPGYVERIKDYPDDVTTSRRKGKNYFAYVAEPYKLRSGPSDFDSKNSVAVKRGTKVQVLMMPEVKREKGPANVTQKWVLVKTADYNQGYIPVDLLLQEAPSRSAGGPAVRSSGPKLRAGGPVLRGEATRKMQVTADSLNVRSEPNSGANKLDSLDRGTIVDVLEFSENTDYIDGREAKWAKIRWQYLEGWVFSGYLGEPGSSGGGGRGGSEEPLQDFQGGQTLYVKSDILRVRDAPGNDGTVLFSLKNRDSVRVTEVLDETVTLAGKKSKWVGVKHRDYEGWVFGAFLGPDSSSYVEGDDIDKQFIFPFNDPNIPITSNYGWRSLNGQKNYHKGIDLGARQGTPILAAADGTVIHVKEDYRNCSSCGYGSYVILQHNNGHRSLYGHMSQVGASMGQKFGAGEVIGKVGNTGHSYGAHLHFEIIAYEEYVDPNTYLHAHLYMLHRIIEQIAML